MGKKGGKKRFIEKGGGQHFYLMHRSQTDGAYAEGETPSDFVLVNSNQTNQVRPTATVKADVLLKTGKDHFDALGFRNDGYDYSKHLKEMGGGHFIGADGTAQPLPASAIRVALPASALPSETELDRALQSITIDPELMDPDLRAALFEEGDEDGGFEELQDDFISQCLTEPEVQDFDYDAHIANLIAQSERKTGDAVGARGWGDEKNSQKQRGVRFAEDEEDEDESGEFESYCSDDNIRATAGNRADNGAGGAHLDDLFDRTLEEYGSDDMGDLEDEAEDIHGAIDVNEEGTLLDDALNEFIQERNDIELTEGVKLSEVEKTAKGARFLPEQLAEDEELDEKEVAARIEKLKMESSVLLPPDEDEDPVAVAAVMKSVAYLAEEREEEQWDCETILTTYSTLDNHPSLIKDGNANKNRKKKDRRPQKLVSEGVSTSRSSISEVAGADLNTKIILAGKLGLPKVVVAGPLQRTPISEVITEESGDEEHSGSDESREDRYERPEKEVPGRRNRKETAEEKKARKEKVKEERRVNRATKKQFKQAFSTEYQHQINTAGKKQDIDHISVFKYS